MLQKQHGSCKYNPVSHSYAPDGKVFVTCIHFAAQHPVMTLTGLSCTKPRSGLVWRFAWCEHVLGHANAAAPGRKAARIAAEQARVRPTPLLHAPHMRLCSEKQPALPPYNMFKACLFVFELFFTVTNLNGSQNVAYHCKVEGKMMQCFSNFYR